MTKAIIIDTSTDLKQRLDEIDNRIQEDYRDIVDGAVKKAYYMSRLKILQGQWEKGRVIAGQFRGVNCPSYRELERETGRHKNSLKAWHTLAETYKTELIYLHDYADPKAQAWTEKTFANKQELLKVGEEEPPVIDVTPEKSERQIIYESILEDVKDMESAEEIINFLLETIKYYNYD